MAQCSCPLRCPRYCAIPCPASAHHSGVQPFHSMDALRYRYATSITLNRWHYLSCVAADTDHHNPDHHPQGYRYGKAFRGAVLMPSRCSRPSVARALSLLSLLRPSMPCLRSKRYLAVSLALIGKHHFSRVALEHSNRNLAQCLFVSRSVRARAKYAWLSVSDICLGAVAASSSLRVLSPCALEGIWCCPQTFAFNIPLHSSRIIFYL